MLLKFADHLKPSKSLTRYHKGIVVDNKDPLKLGRVRCTVKRMFEDVSEDFAKLPWIIPKNSPNKVDIPKIGEELIIVFPFTDIYSPFYDGHWHNLDNHNPYFDGEDGDYPNISGFAKDNLKAKFDDVKKTGEIEHSSGTKVGITETGTVEVSIAEDLKLSITGKYEVNSKGDISFASDAKISFTGKGGLEFSTDAKAEFVGKGGTDIGDASSMTNINGNIVNIAGGGLAVAYLGAQVIGQGNLAIPVVSNIVEGSSKVTVIK